MLLIEQPTAPTPPTIEVSFSRAVLRQQAELFKALSDPNRLRMLYILLRKGDMICVSEMTESFFLEQPTVSHHLRILREAGLVDYRKTSLWVYYHVEKEALQEAKAILEEMLATEVEA